MSVTGMSIINSTLDFPQHIWSSDASHSANWVRRSLIMHFLWTNMRPEFETLYFKSTWYEIDVRLFFNLKKVAPHL